MIEHTFQAIKELGQSESFNVTVSIDVRADTDDIEALKRIGVLEQTVWEIVVTSLAYFSLAGRSKTDTIIDDGVN